MFTLFILVLKDGLFCLLKKLIFISSLFSSKNPFNFLGVVVVVGGGGGFYIFDVPRGEGFNNFRWNPTGEEGGQENTILKGTSKMYGSLTLRYTKVLPQILQSVTVSKHKNF